MITPIDVCRAITGDLTADSYTFFYGKKPDQNFGRDDNGNDIEGKVVFMDPFIMDEPTSITNVSRYKTKVFLTFGHLQKADEEQLDKEAITKAAIEAAREFHLRLRAYDKSVVQNVGDKHIETFESLFDINYCGCFLETTFDLIDSSSTCLS